MGYKTTGPISGAPNTGILSAATTLTVEDSGKVFFLDDAAGYAITLPPVADAAGCYYKFILAQETATTDWVITAQTAVLQGSLLQAGLVQLVAADTTINIELGVDVVGDWLEVTSNGTDWFVWGVASEAATFTPA